MSLEKPPRTGLALTPLRQYTGAGLAPIQFFAEFGIFFAIMGTRAIFQGKPQRAGAAQGIDVRLGSMNNASERNRDATRDATRAVSSSVNLAAEASAGQPAVFQQPPPFPTGPTDRCQAGVFHGGRSGESGGENLEIVTAMKASQRVEDLLLRCVGWAHRAMRFVAGLLAVWFLLAWLATIPLLQFLTLGFFLEVTHRVSRSRRLRDGLLGAEKGWIIGKWLCGIAITWLPLMVVSRMRYDAWLIDPTSTTFASWRFWEFVVFGLTMVHWLGVGLTGGQLRHFFWPLLVPWYLASGLLKRLLSVHWVQLVIEQTVGAVFPRTVAAYYHAVPLSNWFVPAVLWRHLRQGTLLSASSDRFWGWVASLRPAYYFSWGCGAFGGLLLWFGGPTLWFLIATRAANPGVEGLFFSLGLLHLFLVLQYFPLVLCRYAETGRWSSYFQWRTAARRFRYGPLRLTLAAAATLVLTFPLWLTRVAMIPYELWWLLSGLYVACLWPIWLTWGWAWHHAARQPTLAHWTWRSSLNVVFWTLVAGQVLLTVVSMYTSWQGVFNILLHPTFNIPSPFSPNA